MSGKMPEKSRLQLEEFLKELPLCDGSFEHWMRVGQLRRQLASKGLTVSTPDAHVAQCALDLKCTLISEDRIFASVAERVSLKLAGP
jgi:predicted nucleic acid-binding protein